MFIDKDILGYLSVIIAIAAYSPYIWSMIRGVTKPHIFSWFLWSVLMVIAAAGQSYADAGPGAWATLISALSCIIITVLALRFGDRDITSRDVSMLFIALLALPIWYVTRDPLGAILLITFVDVLSYGPTLRKSYRRPKEEMALHYVISNAKHILSILAMATYSITTTIYPAILFFMNSILIALIYWRRWQDRKKAA